MRTSFIEILSFVILWNVISTVSAQPPIKQGLFTDDKILTFTLKGDVKHLLADRKGEPSYFPMHLLETMADGDTLSLDLRIRTRGHFRRLPENCVYPPLLLNFPRSKVPDQSLFKGQNKLKLVMPCRGEIYVYREYLTYQLANLISPNTFKARLVRVVLLDTQKQKASKEILGFLLEDEDEMAARIDGEIIKDGIFRPEDFTQEDFLLMASLQFLIGNTDWSTQYRQNIKVVETKDKLLAIPYDFDHAGLVFSPYAKPAAELELNSVRDRRYRGYCVDDLILFEPITTLFNEKKDEIYTLYSENSQLKNGYKKSTLRYFDAFYKIINDPELFAEAFQYPCSSDNTGNVIIRGLRDN